MSVHVWSENLIKDLQFKQRLGLKADLVDEITAVVEQAFEKAQQDKDGLKVDADDVSFFNSLNVLGFFAALLLLWLNGFK